MSTTHSTRWSTLIAGLALFALFLAACGPSDGDGADAEGGEDVADGIADDTSPDGTADAGSDARPDGDAPVDAGDDDAGLDVETGVDADDGSPDTNEQTLALAVSTTDMMASPTTSTIRTTIDFSTGAVADKKTYRTGDLLLDGSAGRLFALDRRCSGPGGSGSCSASSGSVAELSVADDGALREARALSLPNGIYNPHGAAVTTGGGETFVTSYASSKVYIYDSSGARTDSIDVGPFDAGATSSDMDPEPSEVAVEGDYLYVLLLRLSGFTPKENSALVGYDTSSDSFVDFDSGASGPQALDLRGENANGGLHRGPQGNWHVGLTGKFRDSDGNAKLDGSIVRLGDEGNGKLSVGTTVATEKQLDGNLLDFVFTAPEVGVATVLKGGAAKAVKFDATGASTQTTKLRSLGGYSSSLCMPPDRSEVWVGVSTKSGTKFVGYDPKTGSELTKKGPTVAGGLPSCQFVRSEG